MLDHFIDQNRDGILILNDDAKLFRSNSEFLRIFGLSEEEVEEELSRIHNPGKWDQHFPFSLKQFLSLPLKEEVEIQILRSGNQKMVARLFRDLVKDKGEIIHHTLTAREVSEETSWTIRGDLPASQPPDYLRHILDVNPNLIYVKNQEGEVTLANQSVADFFGCTAEEFLGDSSNLFKTYKWKYEEIQHIEDQALKNFTTITSEEALFSNSTKKMHLFQVTRTPFLMEDKPNILCVAVDITDRVNAENELITQREYLRHILDTDPNLIFVKDAIGRFVLVNRAFAEFYNTTVDAIIGKFEKELPWKDKERTRFLESDQEVMSSNEASTTEELITNPVTGKDAHFITTKKPMLDADGNMNILGVVTDITEQKRQEKNVRKSELMLQEIFNRVADALFIIDAQTLLIVDCNPQAIFLFATDSKEELLNTSIRLIKAKDDRGQRFWTDFLSEIGNINPSRESELVCPDGAELWASLAATQFVQDGKNLILLRVADITAQKKSEEQIMVALHEKEILIQEIHHRVKNNMAVISSLLQLQTGYIKDPALIDVFRDSQSRIKSMALIHEKLYQSKTLAKVEMESYIRELARTLLYTYNSRKIDIAINISADEVYLDINSAVPCGLIINEIISNACKHAFAGKDRGQIDIEFTNHEGQFQLSVKDDGIGMAEGTDFSSFNSLGMSLVNALSSQLGAHLEVHTKHGVSYKLTFSEKTKPTK